MDRQRREDGNPVGPCPWQRQGAVYDTRPPRWGTPSGTFASDLPYLLERLLVFAGVDVAGRCRCAPVGSVIWMTLPYSHPSA